MDIDDPELDARLAALYDAENPWRESDDFFLAIANRRPRSRVLDLGCGTGRLTTALALAGHEVMGVDPNPAFLNIARTKIGAERVTWLRGTSSDLAESTFDTALMTSHVAQEILTDRAWRALLGDIHRVLVPGGTFAFDTRDPSARAWESWATTHAGTTRIRLGDGTAVDSETTMTIEGDVVRFESASVSSDGSSVFNPVQPELVPGTTWSRASYGYRFRSADLVRSSLEDAGFRIQHLFGGWHDEAVGEGPGEIAVVATV